MRVRHSLDELKEYLAYDPGAGVFRWRKVTSFRVKVGALAGCRRRNGYVVVCLDQVFYYAHQLVWLFETGSWPEEDIDHANRNKSDNRFVNLRAATRTQNNGNQGLSSRNTSGIKGVSWNKAVSKWCAQIGRKGQRHLVEFYASKEQAAAAYERMAQEYFGEFARPERLPEPQGSSHAQ